MRVVLWHHCETALERSRATISPTKEKAVCCHGAAKQKDRRRSAPGFISFALAAPLSPTAHRSLGALTSSFAITIRRRRRRVGAGATSNARTGSLSAAIFSVSHTPTRTHARTHTHRGREGDEAPTRSFPPTASPAQRRK